MSDPAHTISTVVLSIVTDFTQSPGDTMYAAITLWNWEWQWRAHGIVTLSWNTTYGFVHYATPSYATHTDTVSLLPYPISPLGIAIKSGASPSHIWQDSLASDVAYDDANLGALLQTLVVSLYAYNLNGASALGTAHMRVYAAYVDVTYADSHVHRYWASGKTVVPPGNPAWGHPIPPTDVLNPELAIDESLTTFADIEETNKVGILSPLAAPAVLVLDWGLHILCGDPPDGVIGAPYSYLFTISGGIGPYSMAITGGALPDGLSLATDGTASGTPTREGTFSFTLTATDAGSTDTIVTTAQAGGAGMSMPTLTPSATLAQGAASTAAYMGVNALNYPYWAIAVAVSPPTTPVAGIASYEVTAQTCTPAGVADGAEKDFYNVSATPDAPVKAQTLLGDYAAAPNTAVKFRLYSVAATGGTRNLLNAWSGSSIKVIDAGTTPTPGGPTMPVFPTTTATVAEASSSAVYMGLNSLSQQYWSIAVATQPVGTDVYVITAQVTDAGGTADPAGSEKDFFLVEYPRVAVFPSQNLLGPYQSSPTSTYTSITFRMYVANPDGTRTLLPVAWPGNTNHQTVPFGVAPTVGTVPVPAALPPVMTASVICSLTIGSGVLSASCGTPGIVTLGTPFTFRPTVMMGTIVLDSSYDADGTLTWLVTDLPPGLIWDYTSGSATYGTIAGVATEAGTFVYSATITASDGQTASLTCTLQVEGELFSPLCGTPPTAAQGLPFSFHPPFTDSTAYAGWTFTGLPPGLAWDSAGGNILGTPTTLGAYVYTATRTGASFTCSITVVVAGDSGPALCGGPGTLIVGIPFAFTPPFTAQAPAEEWVFSGLPPGLGWDTDLTSATYASIAGIPSAPGGYGYHATATDVDGHVLLFTCSFNVLLPGDAGDGANDSGGQGACWWLDLWVWQPVFAFQVLQQEFQMPPAYQRALRYTLARELANVYGRDPAIVAALASEAVAEIDAMDVSNAAGTEDPPPPPPPVVVQR